MSEPPARAEGRNLVKILDEEIAQEKDSDKRSVIIKERGDLLDQYIKAEEFGYKIQKDSIKYAMIERERDRKYVIKEKESNSKIKIENSENNQRIYKLCAKWMGRSACFGTGVYFAINGQQDIAYVLFGMVGSHVTIDAVNSKDKKDDKK